MSCFGCCGDEDTQRAPDNRNQYPGSHPARNDAYRTADPTPKGPQPVKVQPIAVPTIPMDEIREVTKGFGDEALIGEGSFGRVYFGVLRNGRSAAVKKLDSSKQPDQELLAQVSMVSRLKHENVVELLGYCLDGSTRVLAYEFATMGSLHDMLHGRKGVKGAQPGPVLSWVQRVKIAVGAAKGLEYLHEKAQPHIIHRDIKSSNVLLFDDEGIRVITSTTNAHTGARHPLYSTSSAVAVPSPPPSPGPKISRAHSTPSGPREMLPASNHLLLLALALVPLASLVDAAAPGAGEGFCSVEPSSDCSKGTPLYWKVTNPTLAPVHLQDLPGFTRSVYKKDHALITPESHVFSPLPDWTNSLGAYLISPALGAHFTMYLANMQDGSKSALPPKDVERLIFVLQGSIALSLESGTTHSLLVDSYAYLPANMKHSMISDGPTTLVIFERRYTAIGDHHPDLVVGSTDKQPLLETPGEVFELRKLLPTSLPYDFNIHIMDFQPGEYLNVKEVHYNQHGLLLLEGQGIYRLGDSWYPVQAGDTIWMAPFVPQWYAALGKTKSRYLLYKDVNRNPLI